MLNVRHITSCIAALSITAAQSAAGQNDEVIDPTTVKCVPMSQILLTKVADDRNVLFFRRDGRIYLNVLDQNCPGLRRNSLFKYNVRSGIRTARLCDTDAITVFQRATGTLGFNCRLGQFHPISALQADNIMLDPGSVRNNTNIVVEPVELAEEDEANGAEQH